MSNTVLDLSSIPQIGLPEKGGQRPPSMNDIPHHKVVLKSHPDFAKYDTEDRFDYAVFRALVIGGFEDRLCPSDEGHVVMAMAGAIQYVCCRELIDPDKSRFMSPWEKYSGVWQLVWTTLEDQRNSISPKIRSSLCRLLVTQSDGGGYGERPSPYCKAGQIWKNGFFFSGAIQSFDTLSLKAYQAGPGLDTFEPDDRLSLEKLIEGMKLMRQLLEEKVRPLYHW